MPVDRWKSDSPLSRRSSAAEVDGDHERAIKLARESYDTLQELNGPEGEWVRSAGFQLARALAFSGRPAEALPFYVSALAVAEAEGDPINRGSIPHHIGNCQAYAERWQAAMHAYRKAAEQFVELEAVEFISNALGKAGAIVPQLDPLIGLPGRGTIIAGLDDIVEQIGLLPSKEMFGGRNLRVTFRKLGTSSPSRFTPVIAICSVARPTRCIIGSCIRWTSTSMTGRTGSRF